MRLAQTVLALPAALLLVAAAGCTQDPPPDSMVRDVIIETGYVECRAPSADCDGVAQCVEANDAQICVQAPADECVDALSCDCVGAWVCGDLPCADLDSGFACGQYPDPDPDPRPEPEPRDCLRLMPAAIDVGQVMVGESARASVTLLATCAVDLEGYALLDGTDPAFSLARNLDRPGIEAGGALAAGDELEIIVSAAPVEPGGLLGTLRINDDPSLDVPITGQAVRPIIRDCITVQPDQIEFGLIPIGDTVQRSVQVSVDCTGDLTSELRQDMHDQGTFTLATPIDGPVQAGEGFEAIVEFTAVAPGEVRASLDLNGFEVSAHVLLRAEVAAAAPDCREEGVGCLGELQCNGVGRCVNPVRFVVEFAPEAAEMYVQLWPIGDPAYLLIESADNEFTAFNPGDIFKPCDACDAAPDCAAQPDTVGDVRQQGGYVWDGTWWLSDTPDGDDCARPRQAPAGLYTATLCGARAAEVDGDFSEDGRAAGTVNQSFCLQPTQFDLETGGDVVLTVPAP